MKRVLAIVLVVAMMFGMTACSGSGSDTIKIGVIAPLTGDVAVYGNAVNDAVKLYTDKVNAEGGIDGKQIELVVYDDKGDATEAVNAYNKLVSSDQVLAIIGDVTSTPTIAVAQASVADNIPIITGTATHLDVTSFGTNMFRACFIDDLQARTMANLAVAQGVTKAAVIYNASDSYSTGLRDSFKTYCDSLGVEVVADEAYAKGDVDFNAQLTNIAAANPEVIFIPEYYNTFYLIASQARAMGITATFYGVDGTDGVLEIDGADVSVFDGIYFSNHYTTDDPSEVVQNFIADYQEAYGQTPNALAALGYDAAMILFDAIKRAGVYEPSAENWQAIIDALYQTDMQCVTGHITYDEGNGTPNKSTKVITIEDGVYHFYGEY
ncbi:MAG TPA: ABC transporter substrate-binding protein [Oscillospiraceae bacterium]|nr:ABC transporter substrate-binding protein [Oscillospiraceae bacterium]HQQ88908.1 ABC transporter substrate-binding protein [Oscillospiraceae bacterium]HRW56802.1 ABC transporter substrate-binding protein [Oscillospiraceae bacterium]